MDKPKVLPSVVMFKEFEEQLKEGGLGLQDVIQRGAQFMLQCAVEYEVHQFLGRGYYQNDPETTDQKGRRNGYEKKKVQTGDGPVDIRMPQVRGPKGAFRSGIVDAYVARTETLEDMINRMYVLGLSTRDVETVFQEVFAGRGVSKSVVSRLTERLEEDFNRWRRRDLSEEWFWYILLDGSYLKYRVESEKKEPVLAAYGIREDGKRVLLHVGPGNRESYENWLGFLQEMRKRGLRAPLFATTDGNPGVIKAVQEVWPHSLRQRCQKHRMDNILGQVPKGEWQEKVKKDIEEAFHHEGTYEEGLELGRKVIEKYRKRFPTAMERLEAELEPCLQVLKLPRVHRKRVRTTNLLERLFGEKKRRTKVIPHFFKEKAAMKLAWAVLVAASKKWRGVRIDTEIYKELVALRDEVLPKEDVRLAATGS